MECFKGEIATLSCIPYFFSNIINVVFILSSAAAVYFVILGGIKFITSGGDRIKVDGAKKTVTFALVGLAIILLSFLVIKTFSVLTGVECQILGVRC